MAQPQTQKADWLLKVDAGFQRTILNQLSYISERKPFVAFGYIKAVLWKSKSAVGSHFWDREGPDASLALSFQSCAKCLNIGAFRQMVLRWAL